MNRSQKILKGVAGIKSILWILVILRGVYGVMGPLDLAQLVFNLAEPPTLL